MRVCRDPLYYLDFPLHVSAYCAQHIAWFSSQVFQILIISLFKLSSFGTQQPVRVLPEFGVLRVHHGGTLSEDLCDAHSTDLLLHRP